MITIKAGNKTFELFGSIKELPIIRHKLMQQYLLQEGGIGNTVADFDQRIAKTIALLQAKNQDDAIQELTNLRYNFFSTLSGLDFKCMAFACMVSKIGTKEVTDISTSGLAAIVEILEKTKMSVDQLQQHWDNVKKKLIPNSEPIFPDGSEMTLNTLTT